MRIYVMGYGSIAKRHCKILKELCGDQVEFDVYDPALGYETTPKGTYDIGLICTPSSQHIKDALTLKDNCDLIFIEKPLHVSFEEITANRHSLLRQKIHVGCNIRYTQAVNRLKDFKKTARLIRVVSMSNLKNWRNDPGRKSYSFHSKLGGGVLMDFIHEPDYVYSVFGLPNEVALFQDRIHQDVTVDSADTCTMLWKYNQAHVVFSLSYASKEYLRQIEILTEEGLTEVIKITKEDIEESYLRQWKDVLLNGPSNTYKDCENLYQKLMR